MKGGEKVEEGGEAGAEEEVDMPVEYERACADAGRGGRVEEVEVEARGPKATPGRSGDGGAGASDAARRGGAYEGPAAEAEEGGFASSSSRSSSSALSASCRACTPKRGSSVFRIRGYIQEST